jgi:hypothetical protein
MGRKKAARETVNGFARILHDLPAFTRNGSGLQLRSYQVEVGRAILDSVLQQKGLTFAVMFPRQSGKNELQAQLEAYLLMLLSDREAEIVKVSPTWKPQAQTAMRRLEKVLKGNSLVQGEWSREGGYIYRVGRARIVFLSGAPEANIVGATASTLLEVDEAQDVLIGKYDRDIAPMAASTNATRVFWGTAWTARTLLARELRAARQAELADGCRRAFTLSAVEVGREVPEYTRYVEGEVHRLGRSHPHVRTQYFSEEIDAEGGMFPDERVKLMYSPSPLPAEAGATVLSHALLIDVAGEDEGRAAGEDGLPVEGLANPGRDATALTVVAVKVGLGGAGARPSYRVVERRLWVGVKHTRLHAEIKALAERWQARRVVVDATGVGAGLASFLEGALPGRVVPFTFTGASKSQLGWDFLAVVDGGRWQEGEGRPAANPLTALFYRQLSFCQYTILPGPEKRMRWGVPDGVRDPGSGELVHDDLVISAALSAALEEQDWSASGPALIIPAGDPLKEMDRGF